MNKLSYPTLALIALIILLPGCTPSAQYSEALEVLPTDPAGRAVTKAATQDVIVGTFNHQPDTTSPKQEVRRANCNLETAFFELAFKSPAKVALPTFSTNPGPLVITCRKSKRIGILKVAAIRTTSRKICMAPRRASDGSVIPDFLIARPCGTKTSWAFANSYSDFWIPLSEDASLQN